MRPLEPLEVDHDVDPGDDVHITCQGAMVAQVYGFESFPCLDRSEIDPEAEHAEAVWLARLFAAAPAMYAALEACPVVRLGETLEEFKTRFNRWHREVRVPAVDKAGGDT